MISSWNAEWLFDGVCDPRISPWLNGSTSCVGRANGLNSCDAEGAAAHVQRAAEVIARTNADVMNLAEVENCAILGDLISALGSGGTQYEPHLVQGTDSFTQQQVGLLSRLSPQAPLERSEERAEYPIEGSTCGETTPKSSGLSKHYFARLALEGLPGEAGVATLIVLGMHLKAIPTEPRSCNQREAQATIARTLLAQALEETDLVVALGDLNDFDGDDCCRDANDNMPTSRVLRMLKDPRGRGVDELKSVAERLPVAERYTDWWDHAPRDDTDNGDEEHSSLDHMLVSTRLFAALETVSIDHTHAPMDVSDHWPIVATFKFEGASGGGAALSVLATIVGIGALASFAWTAKTSSRSGVGRATASVSKSYPLGSGEVAAAPSDGWRPNDAAVQAAAVERA